jgi:hypothetical protein
MRVIRKIGFLSVFIAAVLFAQNAFAALVYLPDSSYTRDGIWQGTKSSTENGYNVQVDFAVYDTMQGVSAEESAFFDKLDLPGQYIYAYQVFCAGGYQEEAVDFSVFSVSGKAMSVIEDSIGSSEDPGIGGIKSINEYFADSNKKGVWEFESGGLIALTSKHSWFLVFSSDMKPVKGDYDLKKREGDFPVPPEIPEPGMLTLFGTSAVLTLLRKRKKSAQ